MTAAADGKFMSSVKVGPKGQIVIPKEVREMFHISPGDTLLLLADAKRGIALERYEVFARLADTVFEGRAQELIPREGEEQALAFAKSVRRAGEEPHAPGRADKGSERERGGEK